MSRPRAPHAERPPLFFDLDGPLLDVRERYHAVYRTIATELGTPPMDAAAYWAAKRRRAPLGCFFPGREVDPALRSRYLERWLARIEAPEWLLRDTVVPGAFDCLNRLRRRYSLCLVTLRRDTEALAAQIEAMALRPYFDHVRSGWTEAGSLEGARLKASWMRPLLTGDPTALIGDTEVDIQAAQSLGLCAIGVSFGIREPSDLFASGAVSVVDRLDELGELLDPPELSRGWPLSSAKRQLHD